MNIIRPSSVVRSIEDGVIGSVQLLHDVGRAVQASVADRVRVFRIEYNARRLYDNHALADKLTHEQRDIDEINARLKELLAARKAKLRKAA